MRQDKWLFFYFISPSLYYQFRHFSIFIALTNIKAKVATRFWGFLRRESLEKFYAFATSHRFRFVRPVLSLQTFFLLQQIKGVRMGKQRKTISPIARVKLISILHMSFITVTAITLTFFFHILYFFSPFYFLFTNLCRQKVSP